MVALQQGKNVVATAESEDDCTAIFESVQAKYSAGN